MGLFTSRVSLIPTMVPYPGWVRYLSSETGDKKLETGDWRLDWRLDWRRKGKLNNGTFEPWNPGTLELISL